MSLIRYLNIQEVIAINVAMIKRYSPGEQIGVKDSNLLESAVLRPQSSAFGDEASPTVYEKAAAIFQSLGQNHPFHNANKRTAFTALVMFLRYNHIYFKMEQALAENFTVDMVNHKYSFEDLTSMIQTHCWSEEKT
ncbi:MULTISPECIES: type II toxin-antitoxin system death-on-curing family toxin [Paenibacillus]|uniref:Type II toxin-antitoxin system death-on-curing family toxin n=1 Tax=Paenibacillus cucumis (ex Kampfer et al. 2016) TaxID=1776858 RepID=A0ABS7KSJ5_9BACL|nr:type II toxin-antitoxin system death-on-curing family toxin [Paenibacillus cucumis (ex Kampfer et al. 2016)]MBY0206891.1 type II toxin-antitoxin system death-on-curing family toxin [Paenibacillus cucumis (ex Kampfer et al. 2016)]